MTKEKKENLSLSEGIAKNKRVYIIVILLIFIFLGIINFSFSKIKENSLTENTRYFTGSLYSANQAANLLDYVYDNNNIVISPFNINYSLAILYNGTDNNSYKELKNYFKESPESVNQRMKLKLNFITEEKIEDTNFTKLYDTYIDELYDNSYDTLTTDTINYLSTLEKNELILLLKKITLTKSRIDGTNNLTLNEIREYSLSTKEKNYTSYSIKSEIDAILNEYESFAFKNQVNNYIELYKTNLDIEEDFINNMDFYDFKITNFTTEDIETKYKTINNNIKTETNNKVKRVLEESELSELEENDIIITSSLYFDYEWDNKFLKENIKDAEFYKFDNTTEVVEMMYEVENTYLENNYALGFTKDFENGKYSFVAILPKTEGDFTLSSLDISNLLLSKKNSKAYIGLPKINYQSEISVDDILSNYKINEIFTDKANFTKLSKDKTKIGQYTQKISITLAEKGTFESNIQVASTNTTMDEYTKTIILNRPYAYLIINNETEDIMLIGKVVSINESN